MYSVSKQDTVFYAFCLNARPIFHYLSQCDTKMKDCHLWFVLLQMETLFSF